VSAPPPATGIALPQSAASAPAEEWSGGLQGREYAFLAVSLGALAWILPPLHLLSLAATVLAVYAVGRSRRPRNHKLAMLVPILVLFLAAKQRFPRPAVDVVLWGGAGLEAFFVLRAIDWAVSRPPRGLTDGLADRVGRYLLFLFFLPTLFAGPVATYRDFYRSYLPRRAASLPELRAHVAKILWGALKFLVLQAYVLGAATRARSLADAGATLGGILGPGALLWAYVCLYLLQLYLGFSGFCDVAIGVSRILGFRLYENFEGPLLSPSPVQYWKRMHVSAYRWLMTHVFYPYWRHDRVTLKVLTVFTASALWHVAIARKVTSDVVVQVFAALALYGLSVAVLLRLSSTPLGRRVATWREGRYGPLVLASQVGLTFVFTALVHQVFWAGMTGRPLGANVRLFRRLFLGVDVGP
jgi:hypothetical protein